MAPTNMLSVDGKYPVMLKRLGWLSVRLEGGYSESRLIWVSHKNWGPHCDHSYLALCSPATKPPTQLLTWVQAAVDAFTCFWSYLARLHCGWDCCNLNSSERSDVYYSPFSIKDLSQMLTMVHEVLARGPQHLTIQLRWTIDSLSDICTLPKFGNLPPSEAELSSHYRRENTKYFPSLSCN